MAWACIRRGYDYEGDLAGEAYRSPAFTQGILLNLLRKIGDLAIPRK